MVKKYKLTKPRSGKNQFGILTENIAIERVNEMCKQKAYTFLGFNTQDGHYKNNKTLLKLKCSKCGNVWSTTSYDKFMQGRGCPQCMPNHKKSKEEMTKAIQGICQTKGYTFLGFCDENKYNSSSYLKLKCSKCGNIWETCTYTNFIRNRGCPNCRKSHMEEDIETLLHTNSIQYIYQASKKHLSWIGKQSLDFYLPDYNIAIECQGLQHFVDGTWFKTPLSYITERDNNKLKLCEEHGIKVLYYVDYSIKSFPYKVIKNKDKLLEEILSSSGK